MGVEYGGTFMLRVVRGRVAMTPFQRAFTRASHAHAAVRLLAALICQVLADAAELSGFAATLARAGMPLTAILLFLNPFRTKRDELAIRRPVSLD